MTTAAYDRAPATTSATARALLVVLAVLAVLGVAAGRAPLSLEVAVALALAAVLALAALRYPTAAVVGAVVLVLVVPFYAGRYVTGSIGVSPMTAACLVLLPLATARLRDVRLGMLDVAVGVLVLLRILAYVLNYETGLGAAVTVVLAVALPYAVFRTVTVAPRIRDVIAWVVVLVGTALAFAGVRERSSGRNRFHTLLPTEYEAAQWARPELRGGGVRAEASFGHPIAFGMFLALALVLAVALFLASRSLWASVLLLLATGGLVLGLTATLSRGPLLVGAVGVVAVVLLSARRIEPSRLWLVALTVAGVALLTPVGGTVSELISASSGDTAEAASARYRLGIVEVVRDSAQFSLLGKATGEEGGVTPSLVTRVGLKSIDSEFALTYLVAGALGLAALLVIALGVLAVAIAPGLSVLDRGWAVGLAASYLNLTTVALLTQYEEIFWAATAAVAAIAQRRRLERPAGPDRLDRREPEPA